MEAEQIKKSIRTFATRTDQDRTLFAARLLPMSDIINTRPSTAVGLVILSDLHGLTQLVNFREEVRMYEAIFVPYTGLLPLKDSVRFHLSVPEVLDADILSPMEARNWMMLPDMTLSVPEPEIALTFQPSFN
jgi:hypothetical protein